MLKHEIDIKKVADGLGINEENTRKFLNDGRISGKFLEFLISEKMEKEMNPNPNGYYDVGSEKKYEVRIITKASGVKFNPSNQIGKGRRFCESEMVQKFNKIDGFYLGYIENDIVYCNLIDIDKIKEIYTKTKKYHFKYVCAKNEFF